MKRTATFDMAPGKNPTVVRQTAAAAIALPTVLHLARIDIHGLAAEPTCLQILYDGVNQAQFPCPGNADRSYFVDSKPIKDVANTWLTVSSDDTPTEWILTFDTVGYGPHIAHYRGLLFQSEVANSGTAVTLAFPEGLMVPLAANAWMTGGAIANAVCRWAFPAVGSFQVTFLGSEHEVDFPATQAPPLPPADSLTMTPTIVGAGSQTFAIVYY